MKFTVQQIADILEGIVDGDEQLELSKLSKIEEGEKGSLSFLSNPKYTPYIYNTQASAVIVNKDFLPEQPVDTTLIKVEDSYKAFSKLLEYYQMAKMSKTGIEQPSFIHETAQLGDDVYVGAFAYIGENVKIGNGVKIFPQSHIGDNVTIGDHSVIFSSAQVLSDCVIGNRVVINSGCVIGADGFGFSPNPDGTYSKVPQTGNVIIEDHVDVGALSTIDRATLGSTIIRKGAKLDNQIQIAHNVEIGENTVIAAQTGVAGSTKVGKNCRIGGQVGIVGHITIGDNVGIQAQSGVGRNIKSNSNIQGSPAFDYGDWNRSYVYFKNLPKIEKRITDLEKR
ncbi:UDP-3-O-[3-hydroxymyristoyl] glucosamine N-acyltransferase [Nonlabens tegetincola]|uniref:UDP-3-O-acylglucosamine N-acyltransferase n=1 Tax=Nonlabens tegetincola TaxID=323273 RepID=A0A090Q5U3_9FLAO|nr:MULTISPECIES: UDP-3-O-(3-hydroxymyristoyl)glucosamine N-acyltransferase [Nonlabens]ALM19769.1 UDP-3-O-(3-hydroxymyristoyl) glucosamine N-acyltransferase [Nonlabens sp. MIC269]GAK97552.1 UDP-3-O-[3-hydroxymyristoyl] glucosamine N-acyltransferase [Nonlabens tegetincola]